MIDVKDYDIPYRLGSTRVKPSDGMDNLSRASCAALKAGMSYGKYMAMHGYTGEPEPVEPPEPTSKGSDMRERSWGFV